jgi:hypothetical protein
MKSQPFLFRAFVPSWLHFFVCSRQYVNFSANCMIRGSPAV